MSPTIDIATGGLSDASATSVLVRQASDRLRNREAFLPSSLELEACRSEGSLHGDGQLDRLPQRLRPRVGVHQLVELGERFLVDVTAEMRLGHATPDLRGRLKRVGGAA